MSKIWGSDVIPKKKCMIALGIRPDIIRFSLIIKELEQYFDTKIVMSGQHYSPYFTDLQFDQMKLRKPDINLEVGSGSHAEQVGGLMIKFEKTLIENAPDFCCLLGDNNSTLGFALAAYKTGVPIVHIEGGMRSWDMRMPEERNRKLVDQMSQLHFVYTREHKNNLLNMSIDSRDIFVVGNPIIDVVNEYRVLTNDSILKKLKIESKEYILVTCHRAENVDAQDVLESIIEGLYFVHSESKLPIIFIMMPRTKKRLEEFKIALPEGIIVSEPLGFMDFLALEEGAKLIITDSGTVVEEAYALKKPCMTIRETTERFELVEEGVNLLSGIDCYAIADAAKILLKNDSFDWREDIYERNVAEKIAMILLSNWLETV